MKAMKSAASIPTVTLADGARVPALGLGTWGMGERKRDRAGEIGIVERDRPRRIGGEELDSHSIVGEIISRMHAMPGDSLRFCGFE